MPPIPQITGPITSGKSSIGTATSGNPSAPGEQFSLGGVDSTPQISAVNHSGNSSASTANAGGDLGSIAAQSVKDPAMAVETLKDVINNEILESAKINGYTELAGELNDLSKTLYLNPNSLVNEIAKQENDSTSFSGSPFFDILRSLAQSGGDDTKELVANVLKALNNMQSQNDILKAVGSNIKFLSEYFGKNTTLAKNFSELSQLWNSTDVKSNFEALKNQTTALLKTASESLQNDARTATLIPLVTHNLSRYNTNGYMLKDAFTALLAQVPSNSQRDILQSSFEQILNNMSKNDSNVLNNYTTNDKINQDPNAIIGNNYKNNDVISFLGEKFKDEDYINSTNLSQNFLDTVATSVLLGKNTGEDAFEALITAMFPKETPQQLVEAGGLPQQAAEAERAVGQQSAPLTPEQQENVEALKNAMQQFKNLGSIKELVQFTNDLLAKMPDAPIRDAFFNTAKDIITQMAQNKELPLEKAAQQAAENTETQTETASRTTMETLTTFIEKNINHPAIRSVDNFNASNLLQSMLNAPGVFTPLAHFVLPLQIEDTRAFGELWVDNDADKDNSAQGGGSKQHHLFLTFDVESIGRFEINAYQTNSDLSLSVLYPQSYAEKIQPLQKKVTQIAAGLGYNTKEFATGLLTKPHTLTEVFPKITDNRRTFNVKA